MRLRKLLGDMLLMACVCIFTVSSAKAATWVGSAKGYDSNVTVSFNLDEAGAITSLVVDANGEALGKNAIKEAFIDQFIGMVPPVDAAAIDALSCATLTRNAVIDAVNNATETTPPTDTPAAADVPSQAPSENPTQTVEAAATPLPTDHPISDTEPPSEEAAATASAISLSYGKCSAAVALTAAQGEVMASITFTNDAADAPCCFADVFTLEIKQDEIPCQLRYIPGYYSGDNAETVIKHGSSISYQQCFVLEDIASFQIILKGADTDKDKYMQVYNALIDAAGQIHLIKVEKDK